MPRFLSLLALVLLGAAPARAQWSVEALSQARRAPASASVGGKVYFAGGESAGTALDVVDVYDEATGLWTLESPLSVPRTFLAGAAVDHLVLFAGGTLDGVTETAVVDVLDTQTGTWSTATLSQARFWLSATTVGNKVMFAGGVTGGLGSSSAPSAVVDVYDAAVGPPSSPLAWSTTTLSVPRGDVAAVTVGDLALFAGGGDSAGGLATVDVYDDSTGSWSVTSLSQARIVGQMATAAVGTRAYFCGGRIAGSTMSAVVDVYDASSGLWSVESLSVARGHLAAAAVGNSLLCAGGLESGFVPSAVVDVLNAGTGGWSSSPALSQARADLASAVVGGKALFAGGSSGFGMPHAVVDVYEPVGLNYCLASPSSTGCAASIAATGSAGLAANDLVLSATCVPDQVFLFLHGATQLQLPFGDGFRCVGGGVLRISPAGLASGGLALRAVDLPAAGITSPGVRHFQCWFRDPAAGGAGFNTSDALTVELVP